jgi:hypothetical protein
MCCLEFVEEEEVSDEDASGGKPIFHATQLPGTKFDFPSRIESLDLRPLPFDIKLRIIIMAGPSHRQNKRDRQKAEKKAAAKAKEERGPIEFTRHDAGAEDRKRANQMSMVEEHRAKLQRAKEEVASSKLSILLPHVREALIKEVLSRTNFVVDKALVLLEGFLGVSASELGALEKKMDDRKRQILEDNGMDTDLLDRDRRERKKERRKRKERSERRERNEKKERKRRERERELELEREQGKDQERKVFDDEAERRLEIEKARALEKEKRMAEMYKEMQSGKATEMREQALLKERLQIAYRTGDTEEVERLKERLNPPRL